MLNVIYGRENADTSRFILNSRLYFDEHMKESWFDDKFVLEMIKGVDGAVRVTQDFFKDRYNKSILARMLSTGVKTLCCMYYDDGSHDFYASAMGDNCIDYYMKMARQRDITLVFEHYPYIDNKYFDEGLLIGEGKVLDEDGFDDMYSDWAEFAEKRLEDMEDEFEGSNKGRL